MIVHGAAAELGQLGARSDIVFPVTPRDDFIDMDRVFSAGEVGLRPASNERAAHLDRLRFGYTPSDVFILLESNLKLIDEIRINDNAVVEDGVVFTGVQVVSGLRQSNAA